MHKPAVAVTLVAAALITAAYLSDVDATWRTWLIAHRSPVLTELASAASTVGSALVLIPAALLAALVLAVKGQRQRALLIAATAVTAPVIGYALKNVVDRARPAANHLTEVHSESFPSGHALTSMAIIGLLIVLARNTATTVIAGLVIVAIGTSRVYLGVHWPTDVLAGWLVGALWLAVLLTSALGRAAR